MHDSERTMVMYAQLASIAAGKQQMIGRDRFLILTGIFAARAGWPDVAERCRQLVVAHAPNHLISRYDSFATALRDDDFAPFVRRTERFCPPERAEHLLSQMSVELCDRDGERTAGEIALSQLSHL